MFQYKPTKDFSFITNFFTFHSDVQKYLIGAFFLNIGSSINELLYNLLLNELGYSDSYIGGVIGLHSLGVLILCIPAAFLARKYSHRTMLSLSISLVVVFQLLRAAFPNEFLIPFFNVASGLSVSAARVIPVVLLIRRSLPQERGYVFGINAALSMFGIMIGNFLGGYMPQVLINAFLLIDFSFPLRNAYQASLCFGAAIQAISIFNYTKLSIPDLLKNNQNSLLQEFINQLPSRDRIGKIFLVILPHIIVGVGAGAIIPFIPLYLHQTFGASSAEIGSTMSLVQFAVVIGYLLSPMISRRFGVLQSIIIVQLTSLPFMAIMGFNTSLIVVTVAFLFRNVLMNMSGPFVEQYNMENVHDNERDFAASLDIFFWNLSWSITPVIAGLVIEKLGYKPLFVVTIGFYAASSFMYMFVLKKRRKGENNSELKREESPY